MDAVLIVKAIAMLLVFGGAVALMMTKKVPTMIALPVMAILFAVIAGVPFMSSKPDDVSIFTSVLQQGSMRMSDAIAGLIFGAWFAKVLTNLGITQGIVKKAAELAGDRPLVTSIVFYIAGSLIFMGGNALGSYILVGSIIIPIMITTGVSPFNAGLITILAGTTGGALNVANWPVMVQAFGVTIPQIQSYIWIMLVPFVICSFVMIVWFAKRDGKSRRAWAMPNAQQTGSKKATPLISYISPLIPVVLVLAFKVDIVPAVIIATLIALILVRPKKPIHALSSSMIEGIQDTAGAMILFIGIGMLLVAFSAPQVQEVLKPILEAIIPHSTLGYIAFFTILSPLAVYRGPMNLYGLGAGVASLLVSAGMNPLVILVGMQPIGNVQGVADPTNSYTVWIADFTKTEVTDYLKRTILFVVAAVLVSTCIGMPLVLS